MTKRVGEPDSPSQDASQDEEEVFARRTEDQAAVAQFQRDERYKDEWSNAKVWFVRLSTWLGLAIWVSLLAAVVLAIFTVATHVFVLVPPDKGWLSAEHLQALATWYSDASPAIVPALLIANSWVLHTLARRLRD